MDTVEVGLRCHQARHDRRLVAVLGGHDDDIDGRAVQITGQLASGEPCRDLCREHRLAQTLVTDHQSDRPERDSSFPGPAEALRPHTRRLHEKRRHIVFFLAAARAILIAWFAFFTFKPALLSRVPGFGPSQSRIETGLLVAVAAHQIAALSVTVLLFGGTRPGEHALGYAANVEDDDNDVGCGAALRGGPSVVYGSVLVRLCCLEFSDVVLDGGTRDQTTPTNLEARQAVGVHEFLTPRRDMCSK